MSLSHWVVVAVIALLLFGGRGKISELMGDLAKGIKSFKKGMAEDDDGRTIEHDPPKRVTARKKAPAKRAKS